MDTKDDKQGEEDSELDSESEVLWDEDVEQDEDQDEEQDEDQDEDQDEEQDEDVEQDKNNKKRKRGLDEEMKVDVLRALWMAGSPQGLGFMALQNFDECEAKRAVKGYVDYFYGRCIKVDFSKSIIEDIDAFALYDRDNGEGAAKRALGW